ncbi:DinB family protein [Maribacter algicola]|uniref:DinB family protein n=1 Tax=Meishania litoralis TaxID=3434685 RepID=A0ACC7LN67_9FLAO
MKNIFVAGLILLLTSFDNAPGTITDEERKNAIESMLETQQRVANVIKGLNKAQLDFKANSDSWSVGECLEHLTISEKVFNQMLKAALEKPADPSRRSEVKMSDEQLMAVITDRGNKVKTSEVFEPTGKYKSHKQSLKAFNKQRKAHIAYMKSTNDDLRNLYGELPFGTIDGYQILWFMSGHTERHVQQMEEVMQDANFPK